MRKLTTLMLALLLAASACSAQIMGVGNRKVFAASSAPVTWSLVQSGAQGSCPSSTTCTITGIASTTAKSVLLVTGYASNNVNLVSCTGGGGTWVTGSGSSFAVFNSQAEEMAAAYDITGTGGATSITCTWSASATGASLFVDEFQRSSGSPTLDALSSTNTNVTSCVGTCTMSAFTSLSGSSDLLIESIDNGFGVGSPTSPYTWDPQKVAAYALNSIQTTAPTLVQSGGAFQSLGFAFK